jgi:ribosome maturation factor RimP
MEKLISKIKEIVTDLGYYLYDVEYVTENNEKILRVMIENDTVIDIDDCVKVSHKISEYLDIDDPFTDPYNLEVTSAGAERELRTSDEIKRAVGQHVMIQTVEQKMDGLLVSYKNGFLEIKHNNKRTSTVNEIDITFIRMAVVL